MIKQQIIEEMDALAHKIDFLEDSKFMNNRFQVSQMKKRWKEMQKQLNPQQITIKEPIN